MISGTTPLERALSWNENRRQQIVKQLEAGASLRERQQLKKEMEALNRSTTNLMKPREGKEKW